MLWKCSRVVLLPLSLVAFVVRARLKAPRVAPPPLPRARPVLSTALSSVTPVRPPCPRFRHDATSARPPRRSALPQSDPSSRSQPRPSLPSSARRCLPSRPRAGSHRLTSHPRARPHVLFLSSRPSNHSLNHLRCTPTASRLQTSQCPRAQRRASGVRVPCTIRLHHQSRHRPAGNAQKAYR